MKLTIDAEADDLILAVRAAKSLAETDQPESLVCFEGGAEFFVKRLKAGYSVKQIVKGDDLR